ncbi:hypothetical protein CDAR_529151 [Caerostris darwini]|uniref:Uncharacterized protein n=1 Tax=Caerostris darwini TaxID=1538125 RepID=A0AAV4TXD6_9ARAC|nr:hypothetical protein CDAR_529151 [Caerostris darwini]
MNFRFQDKCIISYGIGGNRSFGFRNLRRPSRWEFLQGRVPHPVQESVALRQPLKVKESVCLLLQGECPCRLDLLLVPLVRSNLR